MTDFPSHFERKFSSEERFERIANVRRDLHGWSMDVRHRRPPFHDVHRILRAHEFFSAEKIKIDATLAAQPNLFFEDPAVGSELPVLRARMADANRAIEKTKEFTDKRHVAENQAADAARDLRRVYGRTQVFSQALGVSIRELEQTFGSLVIASPRYPDRGLRPDLLERQRAVLGNPPPGFPDSRVQPEASRTAEAWAHLVTVGTIVGNPQVTSGITFGQSDEGPIDRFQIPNWEAEALGEYLNLASEVDFSRIHEIPREIQGPELTM